MTPAPPRPSRLLGRSVDFGSLLREDGTIGLETEPGLEVHAFALACAVEDVLGLGVRPAERPGPPLRLRLRVARAAPATIEGPTLWWRPGDRLRDTLLAFPDGPHADLGPLPFPALGRAEPALADGLFGDARPLLVDASGPLALRAGELVALLADLPLRRAEEILGHGDASSDVRAVLSADLALRWILARLVPIPGADARPISLLTVDAEDQQRYFLNRAGHCSTVVGTPDDDLLFTKSCRTIMERCEAEGLAAIFMVTGDELDPSFRDAFGDPLLGLDDNRKVLDEIVARGHGLGFHGFDHEWWLGKGYSANPPLSAAEKLRYFVETSGDLRILLGGLRFLWRHRRELARARAAKKARERSRGQPFTEAEMLADIERWCRLVDWREERIFVRYPGFVRSPATLEAFDRCFRDTVDSSDLFEPDPPLPVHPYRLLVERDGTVRRTRIREIPCLLVDKILRTRDRRRVDAYLDRLAVMARFAGSFLCFVTHTKVLGTTWGHCHLYLHDPARGMALPTVEASWKAFARFLRERTRSANRPDVDRIFPERTACRTAA
ncbi:MAG: hypothetical protein NZP72_11020 [Geminicoccaceae bacterium]|nr:hypothetical protein [Geminicoccaceae bacterium]